MIRQVSLSKLTFVAAVASLIIGSVALVWLAEKLRSRDATEEFSVSRLKKPPQVVAPAYASPGDSEKRSDLLLRPAAVENRDANQKSHSEATERKIKRPAPTSELSSIQPATLETEFPKSGQMIDLPPVDDAAKRDSSPGRAKIVDLEDLPVILTP